MKIATLLASGLAVVKAQEAVKIMALGDSITGSPVRSLLYPFPVLSPAPHHPSLAWVTRNYMSTGIGGGHRFPGPQSQNLPLKRE